jgi:hypothetical protein
VRMKKVHMCQMLNYSQNRITNARAKGINL